MHIRPLKFTCPQMERETYIAAFTKTLVDKSEGPMTLEKAVEILMLFGYEPIMVDRFVDEAYQNVKHEENTWLPKTTI